MENRSLITMVSEFGAIEQQILENDGMLTPEMERALDLTQGEIKEKVDRYYLFTKSLEAKSTYFKDMENQWKRARQAMENLADGLKNRMKLAMKMKGTTEMEGINFRYILSSGKSKLMIEDESQVPETYWKTRTIEERYLDKEALEADILLGASIPGVRVEPVQQLRSYVTTVGRAKPVKEST